MLAPWLTAHLLRTVALLLANPSRTLPQQEQQHALEQLHQAIVAIVHATHANTCSEELDALEVTESLIRNLFSFNYGL